MDSFVHAPWVDYQGSLHGDNVMADYTVGSGVFDEPRTSWDNPQSWFQSGVAEEVLHDFNKDWGGSERESNTGILSAMPWDEMRHEDAYYSLNDPMYRIFNPRQAYVGVGGNMPLGPGNLGWSAQYDVDDEDSLLKLMYSMPTDDLWKKIFGGQ